MTAPAFPRLFALVCLSTSSVEYVSDQYTKVQGMRKSLPDSISDFFEVVRYDPNPQYKPTNKQKAKE